MSEKDWQLGPVLKNKPNSQGTLFRGGTKHMSDERFPRHYTPERMHEVADAVNPFREGTRQGARSHSYRDYEYKAPPTFEPAGRHNAQPQRDILETVARSTVPIEHLQPVAPARKLAFWSFEGQDAQLRKEHVLGTYEHDPSGHMGSRNDIRIRTDATRGTTPIHEIGHHVSHMLGNEHAAENYNRGPQTRGQEEGWADRYAFEHFRDRRGKPLDELRVYTPGPGQTEGRGDAFHLGYWNTRGQDVPAPANDYTVPHYLRKGGSRSQEGPGSTLGPDGTRQGALIHKVYSDWDYDGPYDGYKTVSAELNKDAQPGETRVHGITQLAARTKGAS